MTDVLTGEQRKFNMSRIRGRDTQPELLVRKGLHAMGFRFRLHRRDLPGCPDLVLPKFKVCIFINGCFWHGHHCAMFKLPHTRRIFWDQKIAQNQKRDERNLSLLLASGWRVLIIWECALRGPRRMDRGNLLRQCAKYLTFPNCECKQKFLAISSSPNEEGYQNRV